MKKLIFALVIGTLLVAALTTTALADNGPHGGIGFSSQGSMDACAGCHRAHTAQTTDYNAVSNPTGAGDLLKTSSIYGLCISCHDGTGAYTNVLTGTYDTTTTKTYNLQQSFGSQEGLQGDPGAPLFGGGFVSTPMSHAWAGNQTYNNSLTLVQGAVKSSHHVNDSVAQTPESVWGSGDYNTTSQSATGGTNPTLALTCVSCHDPHGFAGVNASGQPMPSYRLLRYTPEGSNGYEITSVAGKAFYTNALKTDAIIPPTTLASGGLSASVHEPIGMGATSGNNYTATSWWYTINTNAYPSQAYDPFLVALDKPYGASATTKWTSVTFGPNDPAPIIHGAAYLRPATANSTSLFCYTPGGTAPANPPATNNNCVAPNFTVTGPLFNNSSARLGMAFFCAQCHDRYLSSSAGLTTSTGDKLFMFQHDSGATKTALKDPNVTCVDCHNAHGSSATATDLSSDPLSTTASNPDDSSMLKLDNREMCISCHGSSINFQFAP